MNKVRAYSVTDINHPILEQLGFVTKAKLEEEVNTGLLGYQVEEGWLYLFDIVYDADTGKPVFDMDSEQIRYNWSAWIDTRHSEHYLWFEVMTHENYHVEMGELLGIMQVVHKLTEAGILKEITVNGLIDELKGTRSTEQIGKDTGTS